MYSHEDRVRAVKLYIKLGKRTAATIRQLGSPSSQRSSLSCSRVFTRPGQVMSRWGSMLEAGGSSCRVRLRFAIKHPELR